MAGETGAFHVGQWADNVVVRELDTTLAGVRHVTVGAAHATLSMDALLAGLEARVLGLEDGSL